ncbi:ferritin-like domain-containing protein [Nannocystis exedens]|uniref:ferritin-like domain-containing protein n=1 Tax=Nannocystis exedens TaxID=54 RepID=UPI000BBA066F|nr:ferritin-like domain-containing protein [Nannocystis exedens]
MLALSACNDGFNENCGKTREVTQGFLNVLRDAELTEVRELEGSDDDRCEEACRRRVESGLGDPELLEALSCDASGKEQPDAPWDAANTEVEVTCEAKYLKTEICLGRRPQGHHEVEADLDCRTEWFAAQAHLERASVRAFEELATWLQGREAPEALIRRCHEAAADEVVHAEQMTALARREGAEVPLPTADPPPAELFAVALHNAVEGCVSEAFAAALAAHQARHAEGPELRALFAAIAADELRHGQLAWDLHTWLLGQLTAAQQAEVRAAQLRALAALPRGTGKAAASAPPELGWPSPARAAAMAERFAREVTAAIGAVG